MTKHGEIPRAEKVVIEVVFRLGIYALLASCIYFAAYMLITPIVFLPGEHPFDTAGRPDYDKLPRTFDLYMAVPTALFCGGVGGLLYARGAGHVVRMICLTVLAGGLALLSGAMSPGARQSTWPDGMIPGCTLDMACLICRFLPLPRISARVTV